MSSEARTIRTSRDLSLESAFAASPILRLPHHSCSVMVQPEIVVPKAAAMKPNQCMRPSASTTFTTMEWSAKLNGVLVSSRAK